MKTLLSLKFQNILSTSAINSSVFLALMQADVIIFRKHLHLLPVVLLIEEREETIIILIWNCLFLDNICNAFQNFYEFYASIRHVIPDMLYSKLLPKIILIYFFLFRRFKKQLRSQYFTFNVTFCLIEFFKAVFSQKKMLQV